MPIIIEDRRTADTLTAATGPEEVRTPDGRLLGQFIPAPRPTMSFAEQGVTDEELERWVNDLDAKWYTAAEVEARLAAVARYDR